MSGECVLMSGVGGGPWTEVHVAHGVKKQERALLRRHKLIKRHVLSERQEIALNLQEIRPVFGCKIRGGAQHEIVCLLAQAVQQHAVVVVAGT